MKHSDLIAIRTLFRKIFILSLANLCLLALLGLTQRANAATPETPTVLGSISGVVTDANGAPLTNLDVRVFPKTSLYPFDATAQTDANGAYQLTLLPPGIYRLQVHDPHNQYATQWYTQSVLMENATNIVVAGQQVTGVNVRLSLLGGYLTGTVTVQQRGPAQGGSVSFYRQQVGQWQMVATNIISPTGQYISDPLLPGVYRICARFSLGGSPGMDGYVFAGCYGGPDVAHATDVPLALAESKGNLDIDIGEGEFSGELRGVITADGAPRAGIKVSIYYPSYSWYGVPEMVYGFTDGTGHYTLGGLAHGVYHVRFSDPVGIYATTYYTNFRSLAESTPITVQDGQVISNINGTLVHGGALQGNVHLDTNVPVSNTTVVLWLPANNGLNPAWRLTEIYTQTDVAGNYAFHGLWPGVYRVGIECSSASKEHCLAYYGATLAISSAKDVTVQPDQTTTGIDVTFGREHPLFLPLIRFSLPAH